MHFKTLRALCAALLAVFTIACTPAYAASLSDATIDESRTGSITLHKYDTTNAAKPPEQGGVNWTPDLFHSDGKPNAEAEETLADYAIEGVRFAAVKVGDVKAYSVQAGGNNGVQNIYGIQSARLLSALNQPVNTAAQFGKYSDCTMVIYYGATVHTDDSVVYGDTGNPNDVVLTWSRTSEPDTYFDTLTDRSMVYVYGVDLTKEFSDGGRKFDNVEFVLKNTSNVTGQMFVVANEVDDADVNHSGTYYVTAFTTREAEATHFIPNSSNGRLLVYGLEEDTYVLNEVKTAAGYTLLKESITLDIDTAYTPGQPQAKGLCCGSLTASATVDGTAVDMGEDNGSANALLPLKVLNTRGFDLPKTGGPGTLVNTACGVVVLAAVVAFALLTRKKKRG